MAHVLVYYTLLVVIIIFIMFVKLRKCLRMLQSAVSLGIPENSAIQNVSIIIIIIIVWYRVRRPREKTYDGKSRLCQCHAALTVSCCVCWACLTVFTQNNDK